MKTLFLPRSVVLLLATVIVLVVVSCGKNTSVKVITKTPSGQASTETRIINGIEVTAPQLVQISVQYSDGTTGLCTGTVIGARAVLTAAHCVIEESFKENSTMSVQVGARTLKAKSVLIPDHYRVDFDNQAIFNDIAVILTKDLGLPALPILVSKKVASEERVITYGFGLDEDGASGTLKSGETIIETVTENHLFAAEFNGEGTNSCGGDSGGPAILAVNTELGTRSGIVGLVSTGTSDN
ncbi:trypsin-like serine protease [Oligoflexia bacterium]|nr:trypsin-like serine protease [Oligoflexia bacterium]